MIDINEATCVDLKQCLANTVTHWRIIHEQGLEKYDALWIMARSGMQRLTNSCFCCAYVSMKRHNALRPYLMAQEEGSRLSCRAICPLAELWEAAGDAKDAEFLCEGDSGSPYWHYIECADEDAALEIACFAEEKLKQLEKQALSC